MKSNYTYQANDIGPSWEVMKQDLPDFRRISELQDRIDAFAEKCDKDRAVRARSKRQLAIQIVEWSSLIVVVVLGSWFAGQWFYNSLH